MGSGQRLAGGQATNSTLTLGHASVVDIAAYDLLGTNPSFIYRDDLTQGCDTSWYPQGTLCDEHPGTHSRTLSHRASDHAGATWRTTTSTSPPVTGVLVIDACHDAACTTIFFNEARVFQMFSDGKTTHLRLSVHPSTAATPPEWDDLAWLPITGFERIAAGTQPTAGDVTDPTVLPLAPTTARYVRVEARNDGAHTYPNYIELRAIKLFWAP